MAAQREVLLVVAEHYRSTERAEKGRIMGGVGSGVR
jgi:hypothetical protein